MRSECDTKEEDEIQIADTSVGMYLPNRIVPI
jgi:hypothetical protein